MGFLTAWKALRRMAALGAQSPEAPTVRTITSQLEGTNCYSPVMMSAGFDNWFWVFFVAFAAYFAYSLFTKRGKGRMFGGEIIETLQPTISKKRGMMRTNIKVHLVKPRDRPNERDVGIEMSHSAMLAWSMTPITLTAREAAQLKELIDAALSPQS